MMKMRKKKITVYLTTENEELLDEYRQSQGKIQYSRAVNEILGEFFEQQDEVEVEERLSEVEERLSELEEEFSQLRHSPDYGQDIEQLRSHVRQLSHSPDYDREIEQLRSHVRQLSHAPDYGQEIEQLRSQVTQLTEQCDRLIAINDQQKQALLQAQHRERQFCQQLSQTIETVQTQGTSPVDSPNTTEPENKEFDILDAELVDNSAEDLLFKLSQELGLL